jgi:two-component system, OmpR family, phosphate regulon response regulator PhoB
MITVLVVDDEPIVREVVVRYLEREGYRTLEAADGDRARELVERDEPNLVVLDLMLPGMDGLALCRWIRSTSQLPVIMLTARGEEADRIVGLELGADDYVTKPFSPRELAAKEFDLLLFLASHPRHVFSREQLMDRVWGYSAALDTGTVTVHIRRLREKIEHDPSQPRFLQTVWGVGYRFSP